MSYTPEVDFGVPIQADSADCPVGFLFASDNYDDYYGDSGALEKTLGYDRKYAVKDFNEEKNQPSLLLPKFGRDRFRGK